MSRLPVKATLAAVLSALIVSSNSHATEAAAQVDTSNWLCNFCSYTQGWFGTLEFGPAYAFDESLKFADYRGIDDEGGFISI